MTELLSTVKLSKKYRSKFALQDADIHIKQGDIYGLIGRNGAGKTTLLKLINSQINATSGEILMRGQKLPFGRPQVKIGALVESPGLYPDYSAHDNLMFKCIAIGRNRKVYIEQLLKLVELSDTGKKKAKQFSLGMKQRLGIALAMIDEPDLLLLDEPINGMDPQGIKDIREMLVRINRDMGTTILISSHILDELAKFASTYGIIKDGRVLLELSREQMDKESQAAIEIKSPEPEKVKAAVRAGFEITAIQQLDQESLLITQHVERHEEISRLLFDQGIYVSQFFVRHQSLEDYFVGLTGVSSK